jgi:hypothetical protein
MSSSDETHCDETHCDETHCDESDEESINNNKEEDYVNHRSVIEFRIQSEIDYDIEELFWELRSFSEEMIVPIGDKLQMKHLQHIIKATTHNKKK